MVENRQFFHTPLHSTPPLGGFRRNSATAFGMEKLEWLGYPVVKNFEDIFIHFGATHERDRQTDGHRMTAIAALMHSIALQLNFLNVKLERTLRVQISANAKCT